MRSAFKFPRFETSYSSRQRPTTSYPLDHWSVTDLSKALTKPTRHQTPREPSGRAPLPWIRLPQDAVSSSPSSSGTSSTPPYAPSRAKPHRQRRHGAPFLVRPLSLHHHPPLLRSFNPLLSRPSFRPFTLFREDDRHPVPHLVATGIPSCRQGPAGAVFAGGEHVRPDSFVGG